MSLSKKLQPVLALGAVAVLALSACASSPEPKDEVVGTNVAEGEPIVIGAFSPTAGPQAWPESGAGLEAVEWYINNELGGINGRPVELDTCVTNGSAESAVACANEFVMAGVPVVLDSYDGTVGSARPILAEAGIPMAGSISGDPTNEAAPYGEVFYFTGPLAISAASLASIWDLRDTKKAYVAVGENPSAHTYIDNVMVPLADVLGVDFTVQWADPPTANWSAIAAAQVASGADMTGAISLPEDSCTQLFAELRRLDPEGESFVGSCSQYIDELGEEAAGTLTAPRLWSPRALEHAPAAVAADIEAFIGAMEAVGHGDLLQARAAYAFAGAVTIAQALATVDGEITPDSAREALKSIKDQKMFLGPTITCDGEQWPGLPTSCTSQSIYFEVQADGTFVPGEPEGFTDLPQSIIDTLSRK